MYTRDQLIETLKTGTFNVTFTKVNGEVRTMPCTLEGSQLPIPGWKPDKLDESVAPRKLNMDVLSVWCVDIKEWRSFRVEKVTDIQPYNTDSN